jgi:2-isopropylmalate synthase
MTLALNLFSQGVDPGLDLSDVPEIVRTVEACNRLPVHPRHPYGGELVFTAFSGSHQDAIKKGLAAFAAGGGASWEVPYLAVDPKDLGRTYDTVVRVNSQSGKGGVAYVLDAAHGLDLPRGLQADFSRVIQARAEASGGEIAPDEIRAAFEEAYVRPGRLRLAEYVTTNDGVAGTPCTIDATLTDGAVARRIYGDGTGPIDAFVDALQRAFGIGVHVRDFHEHALGAGEDAAAVAYVELAVDGEVRWGAGIDRNIVTSSLAAIVAAVGRSIHTLAPAPRKESTHATVAV